MQRLLRFRTRAAHARARGIGVADEPVAAPGEASVAQLFVAAALARSGTGSGHARGTGRAAGCRAVALLAVVVGARPAAGLDAEDRAQTKRIGILQG